MSRLSGVVCYWEFVSTNSKDGHWRLAESYGIDRDGYCLTRPSTGGHVDGHLYWLNDIVYHHEGKWRTEQELNGIEKHGVEKHELDRDLRPIMGRAVTIWDMQHGTKLLDLHPPEWASWLSVDFCKELCKLPNWHSLLRRGVDLYWGTTQEAEKYVTLKGRKARNENNA